jgi:hypothetical protein
MLIGAGWGVSMTSTSWWTAVRGLRSATAGVMVLLTATSQSGSAQTTDLQPRVLAARAAVKKHADELRVGLHEALRVGGVKGAIGACTSLAPEIDGRVGDQSGFEIGRTALRVRNPENAPDDWERAKLEAFATQIAAGADPRTLEVFDIETTTDGQKLFRFMKPIVMSESCLACHGPSVTQDVKALIARTYSDDKAIGFNLNELRGAFTLVQVVE